uniref:CLIP domain-containing serine protease n=1 Tax=Centruroides hentzi TaxID=88313 RepID=A0A2I9LPH6_9SCOR
MILWILLPSLLTLCDAASRQRRQISFPDEDNCRTPDRRSGRCVVLTDCPELARIRDLNFLRRSICGYEGNVPRVCCPDRGDTIETRPTPRPIPRPPPTFPTPGIRTNLPSILPEDCGRSDKTGSRIIGGRKSELGAWPWLAAVYLTRSGLTRGTDCGGALVSSRHVITATHCVIDSRGNVMNPSTLTVRLGEHKLNDDSDGANPIDFRVREIRSHPDFVRRTFKNDIAILVLEGTVQFGEFIRPICLPYDQLRNEDPTGRNAFVAGWGTTAFNGNFNPELTEIQIPIWTNNECRQVFQREVPISREYICAGVRDGSKDSCQGDSGGPLMLPAERSTTDLSRYYIIGVVSFGKRCATPGYPGVYTRVTEYLDWIADNLA